MNAEVKQRVPDIRNTNEKAEENFSLNSSAIVVENVICRKPLTNPIIPNVVIIHA